MTDHINAKPMSRKNILSVTLLVLWCLIPSALWHVHLGAGNSPDVREADKLFNPFLYNQIRKQLDSNQAIVYEDGAYEKSGSSWALSNLPDITDQVFLYCRTELSQTEVHDAAYVIATVNNRKNAVKTAGVILWIIISAVLLYKAEKKNKAFTVFAAVLAAIGCVFWLRLYRPVFKGKDLSNIQQAVIDADYQGNDAVISDYYYQHNGKWYVFHDAS